MRYFYFCVIMALGVPQIVKSLEVERSPAVTMELMTKKTLSEKSLEQWKMFDVGFDKRLISFHEIPGDPPYSIWERRLIQKDPQVFVRLSKGPTSRDIEDCKKSRCSTGIMVSARGYLPGEKITLRLAAKDPSQFREISFFPRPLEVRKPSGELVLKAELLGCSSEDTVYQLTIEGMGKQERYRFSSRSYDETFAHPVEGPQVITYSPAVVGKKGGASTVEICLRDGSKYSLDLPWGNELEKYIRGDK